MKLILESKLPGEAEWGIRSRLGDINSAIIEGRKSIHLIMEEAELIRTRWISAEPNSEFRIVAIND